MRSRRLLRLCRVGSGPVGMVAGRACALIAQAMSGSRNAGHDDRHDSSATRQVRWPQPARPDCEIGRARIQLSGMVAAANGASTVQPRFA